MKRAILALFVLVACTRSKASADPSATCTSGGSCSKDGEMCTPAPIGSGWSHALQCQSGKWSELEIAPLPTPATASASAQGRTQAAPRTLPKLDLSCNTDSDCMITSDEITDDAPRTYACCPGCTQHAVNIAWYRSFQSACFTQSPPMCPPIGCAMPVVKSACKLHHCEVVTPKP